MTIQLIGCCCCCSRDLTSEGQAPRERRYIRNYVVGNRRSEALLRGSAGGDGRLGIAAQQSGIVLLIAAGALQAVAHVCCSGSSAASCQLRSRGRPPRRIRLLVSMGPPRARITEIARTARRRTTSCLRSRSARPFSTCSSVASLRYASSLCLSLSFSPPLSRAVILADTFGDTTRSRLSDLARPVAVRWQPSHTRYTRLATRSPSRSSRAAHS